MTIILEVKLLVLSKLIVTKETGNKTCRQTLSLLIERCKGRAVYQPICSASKTTSQKYKIYICLLLSQSLYR